tara:strand:+ start:336 stop:581 length:246 start_codon:yes stop_codon:yes gene_type:complete
MPKKSITEWFKYWFLTKPEPKKTEAKAKPSSQEDEWRKDTVWKKPKRTRTVRGRYKADDKSTSDVNEAWEGGKAPKNKKFK